MWFGHLNECRVLLVVENLHTLNIPVNAYMHNRQHILVSPISLTNHARLIIIEPTTK